MQTIGIDIGYGDTKVATKEKTFKFQTAIEKVKEYFTDTEDEDKDVFIFNGKKHRVGKNALDNALNTRGFNFLEKYSPLLLFKAVSDAGFDLDKPILVKTGLSLINWKDKEKYADALKNTVANNKALDITVKLMAQGEGILYDYKNDKNGIVCVVDIGYNTFDFLAFENGKPRPDLSFAVEKGVNIIITDLQTKLQKKYDYGISEQAIKEIFNNGYFMNFGNKIDLSDEIEDSKADYTATIMDELKTMRRDLLRKANKVIFGGGGAYFIDNNMKLPENVVLSDKPYEFANARGYYNG